MGLHEWKNPDDDELDQENVAKVIKENINVEPISESNGPRFYAEKLPNGEGKNGTLFAMVLPGPRLYVDPTAKNDVHGIAPVWIRDNDMFERVTDNWDSSFCYSIMLDDGVSKEAMAAVEWSYERFLTAT